MTSDSTTLTYYPGLHTYKTEHFSADYIKDNPIEIFITSLDGNFDDLSQWNLVRGSIQLKQTLCSENYFIWGGFNASELQFECYTEGLSASPLNAEKLKGKIQFSICPTDYSSGTPVILIDEKVNLFTGYIETVEPPISKGGGWKVTAYDQLYRLRNIDVSKLMSDYIMREGTTPDFEAVESAIAGELGVSSYPSSMFSGTTLGSILYPKNKDLTAETYVSILKEMALLVKKFGMIDGNGEFDFITVKDRKTACEDEDYYCINTYNPAKLKYTTAEVWTPQFFISEPLNNPYYSIDTSSAGLYYQNVYTIKNSNALGDDEWIEQRWECDEYGTPSSKYGPTTLPANYFDISGMNLASDEVYYQQEYSIEAYWDPTIPMGSQIFIYQTDLEDTENTYTKLVESYIMERTIVFESTQTILCKCSAKNGPYNSEAGDTPAKIARANAEANRVNIRIPVLSSLGSITRMKAVKSMSKTDYDALEEKRDDTLYYIYDDSSN